MSKGKSETRALGPLTPEAAFDYMKQTPSLVIIEVTAVEFRFDVGFDGALYIPYNEIVERRNEIPAQRPVILHCREGVLAAEAYKDLLAVETEITELSYIDGPPLINSYNAWKRAQAKVDNS